MLPTQERFKLLPLGIMVGNVAAALRRILEQLSIPAEQLTLSDLEKINLRDAAKELRKILLVRERCQEARIGWPVGEKSWQDKGRLIEEVASKFATFCPDTNMYLMCIIGVLLMILELDELDNLIDEVRGTQISKKAVADALNFFDLLNHDPKLT